MYSLVSLHHPFFPFFFILLINLLNILQEKPNKNNVSAKQKQYLFTQNVTPETDLGTTYA